MNSSYNPYLQHSLTVSNSFILVEVDLETIPGTLGLRRE